MKRSTLQLAPGNSAGNSECKQVIARRMQKQPVLLFMSASLLFAVVLAAFSFNVNAQDELLSPDLVIEAPELDDSLDSSGQLLEDESMDEITEGLEEELADDGMQELEALDEDDVNAIQNADDSSGDQIASADSEAAEITASVENLKKAALQLNRDLLILEEELLFPANTQVSVFLSVDIGEFFRLDAVKLSIDDKMVASHLYTSRQNNSLSRGGIQRLYVGNIKSGEHVVTAVFTGMGPDDREYKRAATRKINKGEDPVMLEIRVVDSTANMQPEFEIKEWEL